MDTLEMTLWDPAPGGVPILVIPTKAEIVIYAAPGVGAPGGVSQTWLKGSAPIIDPPAVPPFGPPQTWTPRLFGGYASDCEYKVVAGTQRTLDVHGQDYTLRNKTTVVNRAYAPDGAHPSGWTDDQIVRDLYTTYRPDFDVSNVQTALQPGTNFMPPISFPVHTLEQMLARVQKITLGWYRIDYFKRVFYGGIGSGPGSLAPFAISDTPNPAIPTNLMSKDMSDMEGGIGTWTAFIVDGQTVPMGSLSQTSAVSESGSHSLQYTGNAQSASGGVNGWGEFTTAPLFTPPGASIQSALIGNLVPVTPGLSYTSQVDSKGATVGRPWSIAHAYTDATGSIISLTIGPVTTTNTTGWTAITTTTTAPAGAAYLLLVVNTAGSAGNGSTATPIPAGEVHYFDQAGIFQAASHQAWQSGGVPSYGCEALTYKPDWTNLFDRIWIKGDTYRSPNLSPAIYLTPTAGSDGRTQIFTLPAAVDDAKNAAVTIVVGSTTYHGNTDVGILGPDGALDNLPGANKPVLIGTTSPYTLALRTAPTAGQQVSIQAYFRYPLIQIYTDPTMLAAMGGNVFEKVLYDKRITDPTLATQVAKQNIAAEGSTKKGGQCVIDQIGAGGYLLQPGQYINIQNAALFTGLLPGGASAGSFLVTGISTTLQEDVVNPYLVTVSYADRQDSTDDDIIDLAIGEQGRVNAALTQGSVNDTIEDLQSISETGLGFAAETVAGTSHSGAYQYDRTDTKWGDFRWA